MTQTLPRPPINATGWLDSMRVPIEHGDRVMVTALSHGAIREDVRTVWIVEGFARTRVKVKPTPELTLAGRGAKTFGPAVLTVMARDGSDGFEGNRDGGAARVPNPAAGPRVGQEAPQEPLPTIATPRAPVMAEHMQEAQQIGERTLYRGLPMLVKHIAQAIADAELRGAATAHTREVQGAAQRVGAFLAARQTLSGMDPVDIVGASDESGRPVMLTVTDLSILAGLG